VAVFSTVFPCLGSPSKNLQKSGGLLIAWSQAGHWTLGPFNGNPTGTDHLPTIHFQVQVLAIFVSHPSQISDVFVSFQSWCPELSSNMKKRNLAKTQTCDQAGRFEQNS